MATTAGSKASKGDDQAEDDVTPARTCKQRQQRMTSALTFKSLFPTLPPVQPTSGHDGRVYHVVSHEDCSGELRIHRLGIQF